MLVFFYLKNYTRTIQELYKNYTRTIQELYKNYTRTIQELYKNYTTDGELTDSDIIHGRVHNMVYCIC